MTVFPIHNDDDLQRATELVDALWDSEPGSPEFDALEVMSTLIDLYESTKFPAAPTDPLKLIEWKLKELGWSGRELARRLGWGTGRVSEVLRRKRPLTLAMVRQLSDVLGLAPGLLAHDYNDGEPEGCLWVALPADVAALARFRAKLAGVDVAEFTANVVRSAATQESVSIVGDRFAEEFDLNTGVSTSAGVSSGYCLHEGA